MSHWCKGVFEGMDNNEVIQGDGVMIPCDRRGIQVGRPGEYQRIKNQKEKAAS